MPDNGLVFHDFEYIGYNGNGGPSPGQMQRPHYKNTGTITTPKIGQGNKLKYQTNVSTPRI